MSKTKAQITFKNIVITGFSKPNLWYADKIGQVFKVRNLSEKLDSYEQSVYVTDAEPFIPTRNCSRCKFFLKETSQCSRSELQDYNWHSEDFNSWEEISDYPYTDLNEAQVRCSGEIQDVYEYFSELNVEDCNNTLIVEIIDDLIVAYKFGDMLILNQEMLLVLWGMIKNTPTWISDVLVKLKHLTRWKALSSYDINTMYVKYSASDKDNKLV